MAILQVNIVSQKNTAYTDISLSEMNAKDIKGITT
jgi:hypothetical protein